METMSMCRGPLENGSANSLSPVRIARMERWEVTGTGSFECLEQCLPKSDCFGIYLLITEQMQMVHHHVPALFALCLGMSTRFVRDRPLARDVVRSVALLFFVVIACMASQITSALTYPSTAIVFGSDRKSVV